MANPRYGPDPAGPPPPGLSAPTGGGGLPVPSLAPGAAAQPQHVFSHYPWPYVNGQLRYGPMGYGGFPQPGFPVSSIPTAHLPHPIQTQAPPPTMDRNFRACNLRNSTGGFGCEPGYNYLFPSLHTKIHVLKTGATPPWQLPANFAVPFHACHVPVNTTVADLLKGFGAKNPLPKLNVITEVCPGGGGKWYKGIELRGDNMARLKMPIKELGWDETRTGLRGQKKVVYIYVQKD